MAVIRTQNGSVLLKNGLPSCVCCEVPEIPIDQDVAVTFETPSICNCLTARCYNNDSPLIINTGTNTYINTQPGTNRISPIIINLQGIVTSPSVVRFSGTVGGGLRIVHWNPEQGLFFFEAEPSNDADYECGKEVVVLENGNLGLGPCTPPRRGAFPFDIVLAVFPDQPLRFLPFSEITCTPYLQMNVRKISDYSPPAP